jgi:hypothetical protein
MEHIGIESEVLLIISTWLILVGSGIISGTMAGLLGIGGGVVLVPFLVTLGYLPIQAVATSSLAIVITSISGSIQNWRMGYFDPNRVLQLAIPALMTAQLGVYLSTLIPPYLLLCLFSALLLINIYLVQLKKRLASHQLYSHQPFAQKVISKWIPLSLLQLRFNLLLLFNIYTKQPKYSMTSWHRFNQTSRPLFRARSQHHSIRMPKINQILARFATGSAGGILAGLFGVGGGVIMVPLQMLLLRENIKVAIQTSLGVILATAISASVGHAAKGNVLVIEGILLGIGGLLGAQISTRALPKLSDSFVSSTFRVFLGVLAVYMLWQAWNSYQAM